MKITMAHGSGGKDSALLMGSIFGKYFANPILDQMDDAAVLETTAFVPGSKLACTTDTFVVTPVVFPGGDIGKLSVCGTVNDLLMMGATPKYLTCGFVLQEGLDVDLLEQVVESMEEYIREGYETVGVLSCDGSPTCGVTITSWDKEWGGSPADLDYGKALLEGEGVYIEELKKEIQERGVKMPPFYGLALDDESADMDKIIGDFKKFIESIS